MLIGLIKEGKTPPDTRVALTPAQCKTLQTAFPIRIVVEPCATRCYTDAEYEAEGIELTTDLSKCDLLLGIKEVKITDLIAHKTYCFFSHTIKKQAYNQKLLQAVLAKNIRLIDWETLTNDNEQRLIAFGRWAGIVGAHNGLMTWAARTSDFELPQMKTFHDFLAAKKYYKQLQLPAIKIVLTGTGRVANGAAEVLEAMGIKRVSATDFLSQYYTECVYTQLHSRDYVRRKTDGLYEHSEWHHHGDRYEAVFESYLATADLFINGVYWEKTQPVFFDAEAMKNPNFKIKVVADVTCDIMPESSVACTLQPSTIAEPIFGYDVQNECFCAPHGEGVVDVMAIDNLPNELPRDASEAFGAQFIANVLPELLHKDDSSVIARATIAENGELTAYYEYLSDYAGVTTAIAK